MNFKACTALKISRYKNKAVCRRSGHNTDKLNQPMSSTTKMRHEMTMGNGMAQYNHEHGQYTQDFYIEIAWCFRIQMALACLHVNISN